MNWEPFGHWTPGQVRLPAEPALSAFHYTLCGRTHGNQHNDASLRDVNPPGGGGYTRGVRHTGMCRSNRSLFGEKSLNIGYGFELENP